MSSWSSKEPESEGTLVKSFFGETGKRWLQENDYSKRPQSPTAAQPATNQPITQTNTNLSFLRRAIARFTKR